MPKLKIQLNHPGNQKLFKLGKGYSELNGQVYREWNKGSHYRKFLANDGHYLLNLKDVNRKKGELFFWGEWEGNSYFRPLINNDYKRMPNGIHKAFHSFSQSGKQNTDPYIYGDFFKYATCKQTGELTNLDQGSLILFGSTYPSMNLFYIDTVFVVGLYESAINVCSNSAINYSSTYKEQTLQQLGSEYLGPNPSSKKKLYRGLSWWENKNYFSFVPCKLNSAQNGFERFSIRLDDNILKLSKNATGKSFLKKCTLSPEEAWRYLVNKATEEEFLLGIRFDEPTLFDRNGI